MSERFILNNEIPADIADAVRKEMGDLSDIKIALEGDMRADGTFGSQWFVFTEQNLAIFTSADGTAECRQLHNTSDIHKIEIISGTSNAVIELTDSNGLQRILRISNIKRKEFSDAVSLITAFIKDGEWKPETIDSKQKTCEKCGKPLPENMNICPRCLDKKKILKRVFTFLRPHRTLVERLFLLMVLTTVLGLIQPFLVKIFNVFNRPRQKRSGEDNK